MSLIEYKLLWLLYLEDFDVKSIFIDIGFTLF